MTGTLTRSTTPNFPDLDALSPDELRAELLSRARALVPVLRERALGAEKAGHVPQETIDDLRNAGLLRVATPARWGGYEGIDYDLTCQIGWELARGCASTGWCYNNWLSHNWMAGMMSEQGQTDYFAGGPDLLSGTASPPVRSSLAIDDDGYRISGQWTYSSGSQYSQYFFVGVMDILSALMVPRSAVTVLDTWRPAGLKGTSTNSITCDEVVIPSTHIWSPLSGGLPGGSIGWTMHGRASYRLTMWMFTYSIVAPVIGAARGAVEVFRDKYAGPVRPGAPAVNGGRTGASEAMQILLAESAAEVDVADLLWRTDMAAVLKQAADGVPFDLEYRAKIRRNQAYAAKLAVRAVTRLFEAAGASSLTETDPLQRFFRDVHASVHHITVPWEFTMANYGAVLLEQPYVMEFQRDGIEPTLVARPPMPPMPPAAAAGSRGDVETPAAGPTVTVPEHVRAAISTSLADGMPLLVSYLDANGADKASYRGSTHVHSESQLALWVRNPAGGLPMHVATDPSLSVVYRNPLENVFWKLSGRARLETDPAICAKVYGDSPLMEQMQDPQRKGVAMIIDVTRVAGTGFVAPLTAD